MANDTDDFVKADQDKPRFDLIPPDFLTQMSEVLTYGAKKYSPNNWSKGADWSRYYSAMQRHMWAWWGGEDTDPETGLSHLAHAACCLAFLMAYQNRSIGQDDRQFVTKSAFSASPTWVVRTRPQDQAVTQEQKVALP